MAGNLSTSQWLLKDYGDDTKDRNPFYRCVITCNSKNININASLPQEFQLDIGATYEEAMSQWLASLGPVSELASKAKFSGVQLTTQAMTAQMWQGTTDMSFSLPLVFQAETDDHTDVVLPISQLYSLVLPDDLNGTGLLQSPGPRLNEKQMLKAVGSVGTGAVNTVLNSDLAKGVIKSATEFKDEAVSMFSSNKKASSAPSVSAKKDTTGEDGGKAPVTSAIENNISLRIGQYMWFESVVITSVGQTHRVQPIEGSGNMSRVEVTVGFKTFYVPVQKDIKNIFSQLSRGTRPSAYGNTIPASNPGNFKK